VVASSLEARLSAARGDARRRAANAIAVIGGAELYAHTIACAHRLVITPVHLRPAGDTMFPVIDPNLSKEVERSEHDAGPGDAAGFSLLVYERHATHLGRNNGGS
jgi:dihydrofolate reductase